MNLNEDGLQAVLAPALEAMGYCLWGVEVIHQHHPLIKVYIEGTEGPINIGQIGQASHQVMDSLRLNGVDTTQVHLEVSSPGMNRRLFTLAQCEGYLGQVVVVKLRHALLGRQKYKGILKAVINDKLLLEPQDELEHLECPWELVQKVNVIADLRAYLTSEKGGKKS
ncbi:MAG: ribosome maturation factor RimP [Gammaproteobacteria bacterium]|jgi:ribosome maturation factor RimP